nr:uncharacterized protein LOC113740016 [Coffea arabica]
MMLAVLVHFELDHNVEEIGTMRTILAAKEPIVGAEIGNALGMTDVIHNLVQNEVSLPSRDDAFIDAEQGPKLPAYDPPGMPFYLDIGDLDKFVVTGRGSPTRIDFWSENSAGIRKHMLFNDKEQLMMAVRLWFMEQCREFQVQESRSTTWKLIPEHTYTSTASSNDHRHLQSRIIARRIVHFIKENALASVKQVQAHVKKTLHYDVSYKKAWIARCKAIEMVFGDWPTSFTKLLKFMAAIVYYNSGTIVVWEHRPYCLENLKTFGYMFWAFRPAIDGFLCISQFITFDDYKTIGCY